MRGTNGEDYVCRRIGVKVLYMGKDYGSMHGNGRDRGKSGDIASIDQKILCR